MTVEIIKLKADPEFKRNIKIYIQENKGMSIYGATYKHGNNESLALHVLAPV